MGHEPTSTSVLRQAQSALRDLKSDVAQDKEQDDWVLTALGETSDPNLNICESCQ